MGWDTSTCVLLALLIFDLAPPVGSKRGGISIGRSRGSSPSRTRGSSGIGSGWGHGNAGGTSYAKPNQNMYNRQTNYGGNSGLNAHNRNQGSGGWGHGAGGSGGGFNMRPQTSRYTSSGRGSFLRSNQFKNMIVGAAAGYLTYQAGKAIIRAAAGPMMWHNRPYYWGSSYYQPRPGMNQMCRMPIDGSDQQFGNIYFQDNTRPREIVWGCGYHEYCCGYECCPGGGAGGRNFGLGLGAIVALVVSLGCLGIVIFKYCRPPYTFLKRDKYSPGTQSNEGYQPGYATEAPREAPPGYY